MSRVYFHCASGEEAEVRGSERAYMGGLVSDPAIALLGLRFNADRIRPLLEESYVTRETDPKRFEDMASLHLRVTGNAKLKFADGKTVDFFSVALNTALCIGNDQLRLMAHLHGQCEIHAYVKGENRAWLAGVIEEGRKSGLYREGQGWESVAALLKSRSDVPLVTSYSVCERFPNESIANYTDEEDWHELSWEDRWRLAFKQLEKESGLELTPTRWSYPDYFFGMRVTALDLLKQAEERQAKGEVEKPEPSANL